MRCQQGPPAATPFSAATVPTGVTNDHLEFSQRPLTCGRKYVLAGLPGPPGTVGQGPMILDVPPEERPGLGVGRVPASDGPVAGGECLDSPVSLNLGYDACSPDQRTVGVSSVSGSQRAGAIPTGIGDTPAEPTGIDFTGIQDAREPLDPGVDDRLRVRLDRERVHVSSGIIDAVHTDGGEANVHVRTVPENCGQSVPLGSGESLRVVNVTRDRRWIGNNTGSNHRSQDRSLPSFVDAERPHERRPRAAATKRLCRPENGED